MDLNWLIWRLHESWRSLVSFVNRWRPSRSQRRESVRIKIQRKNEPVLKTSQGGYAVPKCCFINICSLLKTKNEIKANIALEADLYAADIGICVVSESHLKEVLPDATVAITNYTIYRTDRYWFGNDSRAKGGVAVYIRNSGNLKISDVKRSRPKLLSAITLQCNCLQIIKWWYAAYIIPRNRDT